MSVLYGKATTFATVFTMALLGDTPPAPDLSAVNAALIHFSTASVSFISTAFTPRYEATAPVDAAAAARVDEDLDYLTAGHTNSVEAWRAFLANHPHGPHAQDAQTALDQIAPPGHSPEPTKPEPPPPASRVVAVPLLPPPVVEVENAQPKQPDIFAALEKQAPTQTITRTIIKWKKAHLRRMVEWRHPHPRYYQPSGPPFFLTWLTPQRERWSNGW